MASFVIHKTTLSAEDLNYLTGSNAEISEGFAVGTAAHSAAVNAILHETSLISVALVSYVNALAGSTLTPESTSDTIKSSLAIALKNTKPNTATQADRLANTAAIGSSRLPVYFSANGIPAQCGTTLDVSITGNAASATKVNKVISFKTAANEAVSFDGSAALDLTGGINYAASSGTASHVDWSGINGTPSFAKVATSGKYSDLDGLPTIPVVTLNGSATTAPSFYAPSSAGTNGYVLTANGTGAPTWQQYSGLNKTGTMTSVSATGSNGVSASSNGGTDPTITVTGIAASATTIGMIKVAAVSQTSTSYSIANDDSSRRYAVMTDSSNLAFVNVPWKDTTYSAATTDALGLIKVGYTNSGKNYKVQLDANSNAYVNVPWSDTDTTYSAGTGLSLDSASNKFSLNAASSTGLGGVMLGYTTSATDKKYKVEVDSNNNAFVYVPWTDTNTTYTASKGITISGTNIQLAGTPSTSTGSMLYFDGTSYTWLTLSELSNKLFTYSNGVLTFNY